MKELSHCGSALNWFSSYVTDRHQTVKIQNSSSKPETMLYGVPQGSVLGPLLFTMYTTPLSSIISKHRIGHSLYADDNQIYISFSAKDGQSSLEQLKSCIMDIFQWMSDAKLKLNPGKTEFLIIGSQIQIHKVSNLFPFSLLGQEIKPSDLAHRQ